MAALLLMAAAGVAYDAATMRSGIANYSRVGPHVFPYGIAACLLVLGIATAIVGLRHPAPPREPIALSPMLWIVGGLLGQLVMLNIAGFSLATGLVFAATAAAFGRTRIWITYPIGVLLSLVVWLAFAMVLKLALPAGLLETLARAEMSLLVAFIVNEAAVLIDFFRNAWPVL